MIKKTKEILNLEKDLDIFFDSYLFLFHFGTERGEEGKKEVKPSSIFFFFFSHPSPLLVT